MGIKGIYGEIGAGRRISLAKLAAESISSHGRPLRIAIDISIWLFQAQASQGGASPTIRTLYFRLVRLLGLNIRPVFVFDGPNRPPFKRGTPTSSADTSYTRPAKRLIGLFGFQHHTAPGEAEAECALLQRLGIVDMVLSEDVDTLAFGSKVTIRNWTAEGARGSKAPTHVNLFDAHEIKIGASGLDQQGMVLVALMNGGDYLPAGIPGCGIKVACEAARAGFGHALCELSRDDAAGLNSWRERLCHELVTNEAGYFRTKHKALKIPDDFPDPLVLGYHAHPLVSLQEELSELRTKLALENDIDVKGLRDFVDEEFNWRHLSGAKKFLRQLGPSLLAHKLRQQASLCGGTIGIDEQSDREEHLVGAILARRNHFSTDGISELKVVFTPAYVAGLDLDQETEPEEDEQSGDSEEEDDGGNQNEDETNQRDQNPVKRDLIATWDPWGADKTWIPENIVRLGAPLSFEQWDATMQSDRLVTGKIRTKTTTGRGGMKAGALKSYLSVTKPNPLTVSQQQALTREAFGEYYDNTMHSDKPKGKAQVTSGPGKPRQPQGSSSTLRVRRRPVNKKPDVRHRTSSKEPQVSATRHLNPWLLAKRQQPAMTSGTSSGAGLPKDHNAIGSATPLGKGTHLSAIIRKSLEGTWKGTNDMGDVQVTPDRLVSEVSLIDMTADP